MPGFLLHVGATILCMHAGQAQPMVPNPRVMVGKQLVVTQASPYVVAGCTLPPPPAANGPCITGQWITASLRVRASGVPVLLQDSQAICAPTGTGLNAIVTQIRVRGI
jgi:hypothetical protein